jgi:hypothetical protein
MKSIAYLFLGWLIAVAGGYVGSKLNGDHCWGIVGEKLIKQFGGAK